MLAVSANVAYTDVRSGPKNGTNKLTLALFPCSLYTVKGLCYLSFDGLSWH